MMRIKSENLTNHTRYDDMPSNQREFLTKPELITYNRAVGEYSFHYSTLGQRKAHIHIGFYKDGRIFIDPAIYTKSGKMALTREDIIDLFDCIIGWLSSAARNGFLDTEH